MKCAKCTEFDQQTKAEVLKLFSPDEIGFLAARVISENYSNRQAMSFLNPNNGTPQNLKARHKYQTMIDFTGRIIGKFVIAMEPEHLAELTEQLKKNNIRFSINHEPCPHGSEAAV